MSNANQMSQQQFDQLDEVNDRENEMCIWEQLKNNKNVWSVCFSKVRRWQFLLSFGLWHVPQLRISLAVSPTVFAFNFLFVCFCFLGLAISDHHTVTHVDVTFYLRTTLIILLPRCRHCSVQTTRWTHSSIMFLICIKPDFENIKHVLMSSINSYSHQKTLRRMKMKQLYWTNVTMRKKWSSC